MPQGSVLGPVLFLILINDLDSGLSSSVLKFADDTKLYRPVNNQMNGMNLQHDLDIVSNWAKWWQMEFNFFEVQGHALWQEEHWLQL